METPNRGIVFFGTPDFAVAQLEAIVHAGYSMTAVVTAPDKPAGRGKKISTSAVKDFALVHHLPLLQPLSLKDSQFLDELRSLQADLFVVVAFRMLPAEVWQMPELGTFNLHASLLPQYRGAAPINRAIMEGETVTGLTSFFINDKIDTGEIILNDTLSIGENETAGELHDRMALLGKKITLETISQIFSGSCKPYRQDVANVVQPLKSAPKIFRADCLIQWHAPMHQIHNQIRGLSPYPGAYTTIQDNHGRTIELKILRTSVAHGSAPDKAGTLLSDGHNALSIVLPDGILRVHHLQQAGKKAMAADEFVRGFQPGSKWKVPAFI
ncbi:MAG: methionyl-tRNA formyltransferase [Bacteroidales bacterium]|nr:methionyl-tRNA formyltransferase [Bacteroidales bacterium]